MWQDSTGLVAQLEAGVSTGCLHGGHRRWEALAHVGDITICVSLPGGVGLFKEDSPERSPRPRHEDGGS